MAKGSIVVSLRARGVYTYQLHQLLDVRTNARHFFKQLTDIGCSAVLLLQLQTWTTWFSVLVLLLSIVFYSQHDNGGLTITAGFWVPLCFIIVLPVLGLLGMTFHRREVALLQLAKVKASTVGFYTAYTDALPMAFAQKADDMRGQLLQFLDDLRLYLQHSRSYARHYTNPLLPNDPVPSAALFDLSQQLGMRLRTVQLHFGELSRSCQQAHELGAPPVMVVHLRHCLLQLHTAFERLSAVKEFRTPQAVRALLRLFVVLAVPLFGAPYWVHLGREAGSQAFAGALGLLLQLALVALLSAAIGGEDPFDEGALDNISVLEATDHCLAMLMDASNATPEAGPPLQAAPPATIHATVVPQERQQRPRHPPPHPLHSARPPAGGHPITPTGAARVQGSGPSTTLPMPPLPPLPHLGGHPGLHGV